MRNTETHLKSKWNKFSVTSQGTSSTSKKKSMNSTFFFPFSVLAVFLPAAGDSHTYTDRDTERERECRTKVKQVTEERNSNMTKESNPNHLSLNKC